MIAGRLHAHGPGEFATHALALRWVAAGGGVLRAVYCVGMAEEKASLCRC